MSTVFPRAILSPLGGCSLRSSHLSIPQAMAILGAAVLLFFKCAADLPSRQNRQPMASAVLERRAPGFIDRVDQFFVPHHYRRSVRSPARRENYFRSFWRGRVGPALAVSLLLTALACLIWMEVADHSLPM